ncbi:hypothetical protein F5884DRAFT_842242 [Xylogone sp. PMI_703]|nr:hypothetical protein F5884DRAFT_842242 [Xylogone sp. PMI_703]
MMAVMDAHKVNGGLETFKRTEARDIADLPGTLPYAEIPDEVDIVSVAESNVRALSTLSREDLTNEALWRDQMALTGSFRTFYSGDKVFKAWQATTARHHPVDFKLVPAGVRVMRVGPEHAWIDAKFTFRITSQHAASCSGYVSLVQERNGAWKIWLVRTILERIDGFNDVDTLEPVSPSMNSNGTINGSYVDGHHFDCIAVGGGQGGLAIGSRLQALGISYLIVDRHPEVGDSWDSRYDSAKLHTAREYGHLPFWRTYGPSYPEFVGKSLVAAGHREHVKKFGINIWTATNMESSSWSEERRLWTCKLNRSGREVILTAHHLVFALGAGSLAPLTPQIAGREKFKGITLHSADYKSATDWKGKRGVVIGSANTAHDVVEDMVDAGLVSTTMVQRNRTFVLPVEHYMTVTTPQYNDKIPTDTSDRSGFSMPLAIGRKVAKFFLNSMAMRESERYDALERVGFKVQRYGDIARMMYERMGGHYIDVGVSAKISQGLIKVKSGAIPIQYTEDGLLFDDGSELKADVIVFCTGFVGNMRHLAGAIVGPEIENQLEDFWGLNEEGEIRGAFKNTGHPGVWYVGGPIGVNRYYSRFLAIQIKLALMDISLPLYTEDSASEGLTTNGLPKKVSV